ncbi:hypothetical protein [Desulfovibrio sp. JC010]|uniref:hypothetical protein n=1 Tax=Desulfovibrio sp. JC010 TaxID=2593641 RepID=UPI001EF1ACFA|nr:hypothetical protein [Desulfovibrio sp. JC010]
MKFTYIQIILTAAILAVLAFCPAAYADATTYKCNQGPACIDERVNFGSAKIQCTDVNGDVLSDWVCEYEMEYTCKNELTGEIRKGGFNPLGASLCSKLCGPCKQGWK